MWVEIRDPFDGAILCRFNPEADLIEIQRRKRLTVINLRLHRMKARQAQTEQNRIETQNQKQED